MSPRAERRFVRRARTTRRTRQPWQAAEMDVDVLFAGATVTDFEEAQAWYERFFGRAPNIVANDEEVMWQSRLTGGREVRPDTRIVGCAALRK